MLDVNVDLLSRQIKVMQGRVNNLYQDANTSSQPHPDLLPLAFKELGIFSEELQVAMEQLQKQNEELTSTREEVERQRQRYQELFDSAPEAYIVTDPCGVIKEANLAATRLFNVSQRFLIGKPLLIFVLENERQVFCSQIENLQNVVSEEVHEWNIRICPRSAEPFDTVLVIATIRNKKSQIDELRICIREVNTNRKQSYSLASKTNDLNGQSDLAQNDSNSNENGLKHIYLKGEIIPLKPQIVWQVVQGVVKLSTVCENGEEVLVGLVGPSKVFGADLTLLQTYQATAISEVRLTRFSLKDVAAFPTLAQSVLPKINQRLKQTEALLAVSGHRRVKDRFQELLLLLKQEIGQPTEQGTRLSVRFTHQDLADACRTTRVTITRLLSKLQEKGIIAVDSKNHIIVKI